MDTNKDESQVQIESEFDELNKLNISDKYSNSVNSSHENCSYCNKPLTEELWCKECDPFKITEGWTSGNNDIDKFIKDTIYEAKDSTNFLEWVPYDRLKDIKRIGEGGFSKVYSATWIDGKSYYEKQDDESWKKLDPVPKKVALKRLNGSQNMSGGYLSELKTHWKFCSESTIDSLELYGMTKDPETEEFMMIIQFSEGNLRHHLSNNFKSILWKEKLEYLRNISGDLDGLHQLGYFHKDFHSGNILQIGISSYISDFGLSGPSNGKKSNDKICGVLPYIAPEVLNGESYTLSSDIYSFGIIMTEVSSGKPPFHERKHDTTLVLDIFSGFRPEFGKGTPEIYKKLAHKCMNANPDQRPTASELNEVFDFWYRSAYGNYQENEKFGHKGKEIKAIFEEANEEIPNISTSYKKDPNAIYTSRLFSFSGLSKPVNSSAITSLYLNDEENAKVDLVISSSLQLKDIDIDNENF